MLLLEGKYNKALIMVDEVEESAVSQIISYLNNPASSQSLIRFMADLHAGAGCVIGFTATENNYIIPNLIGVDIGCGINAVNLGKIDVDMNYLDSFIRRNIPCGQEVHNSAIFSPDSYIFQFYHTHVVPIAQKIQTKADRVANSIGTLGGGNHFIELDKDDEGNIWLVIHSGSRNFGKCIAEYHQKRAVKFINDALVTGIPKGQEYLPIDLGGQEYLDDMKVAQEYAHLNRISMITMLMNRFFNIAIVIDNIESVHNYIDFNDKIIRKGAISAHKNQRLIIPLNMRDGSIIGRGKGSKKWNESAPHGAGRLMSRSKAKESIPLELYKDSMEGIYSTCINRSTIDESPFAYKDKEFILNNISETVEVDTVIKPIYNFKASEDPIRIRKKRKKSFNKFLE